MHKGGKRIQTFPETAAHLPAAAAALSGIARRSKRGVLRVERVDGDPVEDSPLRGALMEAGFRREYKSLVMERL